MTVVKAQKNRYLSLALLFILTLILECIPQEAEARRGRAFGRRGRQAAVRVNRGRGAKKNNGGQRRVVRNNNDIFGLDLEPVNVLSSLAIDPFGQLQQINGFNRLVTDGRGRFFAIDNGLNGLTLQAELLRNGNGFFGAVNPFNGAFNPAISSEAFNQALFLNTLGTLGTSCRNGFCNLR